MRRIKNVKKLTNNPYLNLYELQATGRSGGEFPYYVASRRKNEGQRILCGKSHPSQKGDNA